MTQTPHDEAPDDEAPPWGTAPAYGTPPPRTPPADSGQSGAGQQSAGQQSATARARLLAAEMIVVIEQSGFLSGKGYQLSTPDGEPLGSLAEPQTLAGSFFGGAADKYFHLADADGELVATMVRPGSFGSRSQFVIMDAEGRELGGVQQENTFMAPRFSITVPEGVLVRLIGGSFGSREWELVEASDDSTVVGRVSQEFSGFGGMLRGNDRFVVQLSSRLKQDDWRLLALMTTVCLDYVRDERDRQRKRNTGFF